MSKVAVDTAKEVSRRGTMEADKASEAIHEGAKKVRPQRKSAHRPAWLQAWRARAGRLLPHSVRARR